MIAHCEICGREFEQLYQAHTMCNRDCGARRRMLPEDTWIMPFIQMYPDEETRQWMTRHLQAWRERTGLK